jgi:hypothetical protein
MFRLSSSPSNSEAALLNHLIPKFSYSYPLAATGRFANIRQGQANTQQIIRTLLGEQQSRVIIHLREECEFSSNSYDVLWKPPLIVTYVRFSQITTPITTDVQQASCIYT